MSPSEIKAQYLSVASLQLEEAKIIIGQDLIDFRGSILVRKGFEGVVDE